MHSLAISQSQIPDFLKPLLTLSENENGLSWIYQHRQSLEKILCALYRYDQFPDGQEASIKREIEKLILLLEMLTPTHATYTSDKLARAKRKLNKAAAQNSSESATPLQSRQEKATTTIINCRRVVTRFIHGLADIFAAIASLRNIHNLLDQENVNKTLYALAGIFAALKVSMVVRSSFLYVVGQRISEEESNASSWKMRLRDQAKQQVFPVLRDFMWAIVRFLCITTSMNHYREYYTLGLFGFAAALKIMESYQNQVFYSQLCTIAAAEKNKKPMDVDDEVRMLTARMALNTSIIDIAPQQTSVEPIAMFTFLSNALTTSRNEVRQQDMLQVMIWSSYTFGAALCVTDSAVMRAVGGGWILMTCMLQVLWEMKKTDITKLTPRSGFFNSNVSNNDDPGEDHRFGA